MGYRGELQTCVCPGSGDVVEAAFMSENVSAVLGSIPELIASRNGAALMALRDHENKEIRKAARKGLHLLQSRGIEVPRGDSHAWTPGDILQTLRGPLEALAIVDTAEIPGATRFAWSEPNDEDGGRLFACAISPDERVLNFEMHAQTDGQRQRVIRDWQRQVQDRSANLAWVKARVRWARERTIAAGYSVSRRLEEALVLMGDLPSERPSTFLTHELDGEAPRDPAQTDAILTELKVADWPAFIDLESMLERAAAIHGDKPQPTEESARLALLLQSIEGDEAVRAGLRGPVANLLDDAAISHWLAGRGAIARAVFDMAKDLRNLPEPEKLDFAAVLVGHQVASLLRQMGGPEAVRKAMREQEAKQRAAAAQQSQPA